MGGSEADHSPDAKDWRYKSFEGNWSWGKFGLHLHLWHEYDSLLARCNWRNFTLINASGEIAHYNDNQLMLNIALLGLNLCLHLKHPWTKLYCRHCDVLRGPENLLCEKCQADPEVWKGWA